MEKINRSVEKLHHFCCHFCQKWWTIGDAPKEKENWYCPWCGKEGVYKTNDTE